MRRSLDWKRHWLLAASAAALTGVLALELGGAVAAAALLAMLLLVMDRFNWLRGTRTARTLSIRVPGDFEYEHAFDHLFGHCTEEADLIGIHCPGSGTDLLYSVRLKRGRSAQGLLRSIEGVIEDRRASPGGS